MNAILVEDISEKPDNVVDIKPNLHLVTGGKDGDGPWLANLPEGCEFLCRPKPQNVGQRAYVFAHFGIIEHRPKSSLLLNLTDRQPVNVDPIGFCNAMDLWEVIEHKKPAEEQAVNKDETHVEDYRPD